MFIQNLLNKKLLLISGKGGTGKSLCSAALALQASKQGKKVLLVESSSQEQLSPLFAHSPIGHKETLLQDNLSVINLDPKECLKEYIVLQLGMPKLYDKVIKTTLVGTFLETIPGLMETMLLGRLYYTAKYKNSESYDLCIFDAPASGHFLSLMSTPQAIMDSGLMGPLVNEVNKVLEFLKNKEFCATLLCSIPEELIVNETLEFAQKIQKHCPSQLAGFVLNRCYDEKENELAALQEVVPNDEKDKQSIKPALDFVKYSISERTKIQSSFLNSLKQLNFEQKYFCSPELGPIQEPLEDIFLQKFFGTTCIN